MHNDARSTRRRPAGGSGSASDTLAVARDKVHAGATDASMTTYHVARSKLFVRERFGKSLVHLDTAEIEANIEHTRFSSSWGGAARAD
jgi:hypothetical protein